MLILILGMVLLIVFPASFGPRYFLQYLLIFASLIGPILALHWLNHRLFGDNLPRNSCLWPADPARDERRAYWALMLKLAVFWLAAGLLFMDSLWALHTGLGDQWNPFTRTMRLVKGGPFSEYVVFDMALYAGGFLFLSGFLWFPMYLCFERLTMRRKVASIVSSGKKKV